LLHNGYVNSYRQVAVLGIDLGTSGVRAVVASPGGRVLGRGLAGYPVRVPAPGQAESAPEDWWSATRAAVREALAEADRVSVAALAVAGQMHGVVLVDEAGAPLRPAILGLDQRAAAEAASYAELPCEHTAVIGNAPSPGLAGPLLCWLMTHEPGTVRAAWWALQPKDWLRLRLTGRAATDPTDGSGTLLFDLAGNDWADPLIGKLGVPREKLPPVRDSAGVAGPLLPGPASELGLHRGIPVAVGAADTAAALLASGLGADEALLNLGRGGQWVVRETAFRPAGTTNLYRAVGGGYYRLAPARNVGVTLDWVRSLLGATWEELYAAASRPRRPDAPRFDPCLSPERWTPATANLAAANSAPAGAWAGLRLAHEREDLMRSALDGVAALLRRRLDDLRAAGHAPRRVILSGGGTANPAWRSLLAETLGLPLRDAPAAWLAPAGAARLAAGVR
jgi:xylulokinase